MGEGQIAMGEINGIGKKKEKKSNRWYEGVGEGMGGLVSMGMIGE